ncbi:MAG: hypothetical protein ACI8QS_001872, partial [Planctomycetota bacterium]
GAMPRLGGREREPWRTFYDEATRKRVQAHWARDIELFGYDFEGPIPGVESSLDRLAGQ